MLFFVITQKVITFSISEFETHFTGSVLFPEISALKLPKFAFSKLKNCGSVMHGASFLYAWFKLASVCVDQFFDVITLISFHADGYRVARLFSSPYNAALHL